MPRGHYSTIKRRNRHSHTNKAYVVSLVTSFFQRIREKNHQRQASGAGTKRILKRNESVASMRSLSCALRRGVNDAQASKKCRRGITTITCDMIRTHRKQRTTLLQFVTKALQNLSWKSHVPVRSLCNNDGLHGRVTVCWLHVMTWCSASRQLAQLQRAWLALLASESLHKQASFPQRHPFLGCREVSFPETLRHFCFVFVCLSSCRYAIGKAVWKRPANNV